MIDIWRFLPLAVLGGAVRLGHVDGYAPRAGPLACLASDEKRTNVM